MNEAAERYSPEMADAFQPTDTPRPATKKSEALLARPAAQNPMPTVTKTVRALSETIHGSTAASSGENMVSNWEPVQRLRGADGSGQSAIRSLGGELVSVPY